MKQVSLSGSARQGVGKKDAKAVRNEKLVPAVVYGGKDQLHFKVKHTAMEKLIYTADVYKIELDIDGDKRTAIIQDIQKHPVTDRIMHVDFLELFDDKEVKMNIPVRTKGRAIGVMNGGKLQQVFRRLKVMGLPSAIPGEIEADISKLRIGQSIRVKDLQMEGVKLLDPHNAVVVSVKMARGASTASQDDEEEETAEAAAEGGDAPAEGGEE
ncbi:MAG: 50S ribosomal protein L25/general stress protein Ctc [Crocinitomicaceae bacterium]